MKKENLKKWLIPVIGVVIVVIIAIILAVVLTGKKDGYRVLKVENLSGNVTLERDEKGHDIFKGMSLKSEDCVTTGEESNVELLADSDKHILAEANTRFSLVATGNEKNGNITINLEYGTSLYELENKLPEDSEFEVHTPNAIAAVRGTTFKVSYDKDINQTTVEVIEGVVEVETSESGKMVEAGMTAIIKDEEVNIIDENTTNTNIELPTYKEEVAFELSKWAVDETVGVGVKQLEGWNYVETKQDIYIIDEFENSGVKIRYSATDKAGIEEEVAYAKDNGYLLAHESRFNSEGEEITYLSRDFNGNNGGIKYGHSYYKKLGEDLFISLYIYDETEGTSLEKIDVKRFVELTRDCYFVMEEKQEQATEEGNSGLNEILTDGITEEEFPEVLKGNANLEQLKFVIETMQRCKSNGDGNLCEEALMRLYHYQTIIEAYKPISQTAAGYVYDMNELNNMMALMQVENLSADKIPSVCTISGNEVIFKVCDITSPGWIDLTIDNYYMGENNEILVEYTYENTRGSDGMSGVNGKSIAHLQPDAEGKYVISSIEEVEVEEFNWN